MSAVEEYERMKQDRLGSEGPILASVIADYADAAIAELDTAMVTLIDDYNRDFAKPLIEAECKRAEQAEAELAIRDRISLEWIRKGEQADAELAKLKAGLLDNGTFRRRGNP